jgi:hypothetical protein
MIQKFNGFFAVILFALTCFANHGVAIHQDTGQCMQILHKHFASNSSAQELGMDILLHGSAKDRDGLLSLCHAFNDKPAHFIRYANNFFDVRQNRPSWGKPLYSGKIFSTLPTTRSFMFDYATSKTTAGVTTSLSQFSFGDFIDLNADGYPDLVVSFWTPGYLNNVTWGQDYYYKATYLNVGVGWQMVACECNMLGDGWQNYQWVGPKCPPLN